MKFKNIDHVVITTEDLDACLHFYVDVLGMDLDHKNGRYAVRFGNQKFNIHTRKAEFLPAAKNPAYGCLDLCLVIDGSVDVAKKEIEEKRYPLEDGPVIRHGALGTMKSIYLRDPDGNLVEISSYDGSTNYMNRKITIDGEIFYAKSFDALTVKELYEIMRARADVFAGEDKILYPDADGIDYDSIHVFSQDESGIVTSYARMYEKKDEPSVLQMGRVLTRVHGKGLGKKLLETSLKVAASLGKTEIFVEAQKHAEEFYKKSGFITTSGLFMECGVPHVEMRKKLKLRA